MPAKRLLLVTDEMEIGGSQRQIVYLLGGLDRSRWQPELLFFRRESFLLDELRRMGVVIHHLPKRSRLDPLFALRYAALLRAGHYDLVHAFSLTAELWTIAASMLTRRPPPLVASMRGTHPHHRRWFWWLKRLVIGRSRAVIANAHAGAMTVAAKSGLSPRCCDVIPNGVVVPVRLGAGERAVTRAALGVPPDRTFGLFVGRFVYQKNLPCLMRALARSEPARRPWIALVGDGPLRAETEAIAAASHLGADLRFLGNRRDAVALMQAADFLVLSSRNEGMPNVVLEAMAAGCVVIASAIDGTVELIEHGHSGLLFPSDDDQALSQLLQRMGTDPHLRQRLATEASHRAGTMFTVANLVAATVAVYERCLVDPSTAATRGRQRPQPSIASSAS